MSKKTKEPIKTVIGDSEFESRLLCESRDLPFLLEKAERCGRFGFDTESSGPLLRTSTPKRRKSRKYKKFVNMELSTTSGYSVAFPDGTSYYVPLRHRKQNCPHRPAVNTLRRLLTETGAEAVAHNWQHELKALADLKIDGFFPTARDSMVELWLAGAGLRAGLAWVFGLKELSKKWLGYEQLKFEEVVGDSSFDQLDPQARQTIQYACDDAITALLLHDKFAPTIKDWGLWDWYRDVEMPFVWICREMQDTGIVPDVEGLQKLHDRVSPQIARMAIEFEQTTGGISVASSSQLQGLFGQYWPTEINGRPVSKTKAGGFATTKEALEKIYPHCGKIGQQLIDLRLEFNKYDKIRSTYSQGLIEIASQFPDGKLHPSYKQVGTVTGRISSADPCSQNIPSRTDIGKEVLECFRTEEGRVLGSADYSQIDLRVLSHFENDVLAEAYRAGVDVHQRTADLVGCSRNQGKTVNFARIYGAHYNKMAYQLKSTREEAKQFMEGYEAAYPKVGRLVKTVIKHTYRRGYVRTLSGRRRLFPELLKYDPDITARGFKAVKDGDLTEAQLFRLWGKEREAFNCVCQGGASDIVKKAMVDIWKSRPTSGFRFVTQIHDDIRWDTPDVPSEREVSAIAVQRAMEKSWESLRVPLVAEPVSGYTWKDLK